MTELYILIPLILLSYLLILKLVLPMARGQVPPNQGYGFRTPLTLSDERIWYASNRVAGRGMAVSAVLGLVLSVVLCVVLWSQPLVLIGALCGTLMLAAVLPVLPAHLAARRLAAQLKAGD